MKPFVITVFLLIALASLVVLFGFANNGSVLTAGEALKQSKSLIGKDVSVIGMAKPSAVICTKIACPESDMCCNSCGASLSIESGGASIELRGSSEGMEIGCSGNECSLECRPLREGREYIVTGKFKESLGEVFIEAEGFREV